VNQLTTMAAGGANWKASCERSYLLCLNC